MKRGLAFNILASRALRLYIPNRTFASAKQQGAAETVTKKRLFTWPGTLLFIGFTTASAVGAFSVVSLILGGSESNSKVSARFQKIMMSFLEYWGQRRLKPLSLPLIVNSIPMRHTPMTYENLLQEAFKNHWNIRSLFYIRVFLRFLRHSLLFVPLTLAYPICGFILGHQVRMWWFKWLVYTLERSGPTFIKLGQWASTRPDIMSQEVCQIFSKLYDDVVRHSWSDTKKILQRELNSNIEDVFESFEQVPIGAGCIAQVYKAVLRADVAKDFPSREVVVKVAHPKVDQIVFQDLTLLYFMADMLNMIPSMKWLYLKSQLLEFGALLKQQLDFNQEAKNLVVFAECFKNDPNIRFPTPCIELTRHQVLVESYEVGFPIRRLVDPSILNDSKWEENCTQISHLGLQCFLKMLLLHNFTHADLHPGNIMVRFSKKWPNSSRALWSCQDPILDMGEDTSNLVLENECNHYKQDFDYSTISDLIMEFSGPASESNEILAPSRQRGSSKETRELFDSLPDRLGLDRRVIEYPSFYRPEIVILDAGLVNQLAGPQFRNFLDLFDALALKQDGFLVAKLLIERAPHNDDISPNSYDLQPKRIEVFNRRMKSIVDALVQDGEGHTSFTLRKHFLSNTLTEVFQLVREHHVRLDYRFTNLVMSMIVLEGLGRQLSPETDMFEEAKPLLYVAIQRWIALWMTETSE